MQIGKYRKVVRLSTVFLLLLSTSLFANSRELKSYCRVVTNKFVHENAIVLDMGQNVSSIAFGVGTAMEEGLNFSNGLQILGGTFGFGGNITASGAGALIKVKLLKKLSTVKLKPPKFFKKLSCQFSKHADELENAPKNIARSPSKASLKRFKRVIRNLSKPDTNGLSQKKLDQLKRITNRFDAKVRVDLEGITGTGVRPHAHVEGLGKKIESRHIWLQEGVE